MISKWRTEPLREVVSYIAKGIPPAYVEAEGETTVRVLNQKCNRDFLISYEESRIHDFSKRSVPPEKYLRAEDILINSTGTGTAGRVAQLINVPCPTIVDGHMIVLRPNEKLTPRYLGYSLKAHQGEILQMDEGSTGQTELNRERLLSEIIVSYPVSLDEQRAIADTLSALDARIAINGKINHHLEQIAQTVFRHWFVENAEVEGWELVPLPEIVEVNPSRTLKKGEVAPYLDMANMPTKGHRGIEWVDRPFGSGTKFTNGDTLLARITPCLENGKTAFVDFLDDNQIGWGSTEYIVFRPKPPIPPEYGYLLARAYELRNHAIVNMTGTSGRQRTPASCFDNFLIAVPSDELAKSFGEFARPLFAMIKAYDTESRSLASIRDSLLAKLMSGELSVADVDAK